MPYFLRPSNFSTLNNPNNNFNNNTHTHTHAHTHARTQAIVRRMQRSGRDIKARNERLVRSFGASVGLGGGGGEKIETLCGRPGEAGRGDGDVAHCRLNTPRGAVQLEGCGGE